MKIASFLRKNGDLPKQVVDFLRERDTFRNKIIKESDEKSYNNNGKPWKSSRILRVKPNFFIFFIVHHFSSFCRFFSFFHFLTFSFFFIVFIVFIFSMFSIFPFSSFCFIFLPFSCFFFSFFFLFWVARNPIFFGLNCFQISCTIS